MTEDIDQLYYNIIAIHFPYLSLKIIIILSSLKLLNLLLLSSPFPPQTIIAVLMINLNARIIAVSPRDGFVMELMIVGAMKMNPIKHVQVKVLLGCIRKSFPHLVFIKMPETKLNFPSADDLIIAVANEFRVRCHQG